MIIELFCKEQLILVYFIQSILHKIIKMAYSLLRIRKVSPFGISRVLQGWIFENPFFFYFPSLFIVLSLRNFKSLKATNIDI